MIGITRLDGSVHYFNPDWLTDMALGTDDDGNTITVVYFARGDSTGGVRTAETPESLIARITAWYKAS